MISDKRRNRILKDLGNREYRNAFVAEHIKTGVPFQLHALREKEGWTQEMLTKKSGIAQPRLSLLEDPDYKGFTLKTLLKFASAYDVALIVRFVPFSELFKWELNLSQKTLAPESFENEEFFKEKPITEPGINKSTIETSQHLLGGGQVVDFEQRRKEKSKVGAEKALSFQSEKRVETQLNRMIAGAKP